MCEVEVGIEEIGESSQILVVRHDDEQVSFGVDGEDDGSCGLEQGTAEDVGEEEFSDDEDLFQEVSENEEDICYGNEGLGHDMIEINGAEEMGFVNFQMLTV